MQTNTIWQIDKGEKFLPENAHDVIIIDSIPHVESRSSEFKPLPKKKKGFGWIEKPFFPHLIALGNLLLL
jgi:hypothetical protein